LNFWICYTKLVGIAVHIVARVTYECRAEAIQVVGHLASLVQGLELGYIGLSQHEGFHELIVLLGHATLMKGCGLATIIVLAYPIYLIEVQVKLPTPKMFD
jgi:hypothetical protein